MTNQQNHIKNLVLSALCPGYRHVPAVFDGTDTDHRKYAVPYAYTCIFVRLYVRMEMGRSSRLCLAVHQIFRLRYASYNAGRNRYGF